MKSELRIPAIEVKQGKKQVLYTFAVDGKLVHRFATVSRVRRDDAGQLSGYQRPEVLSHIGEIKNYVESAAPLIPNAIVLAFDSRVRFESNTKSTGYSRPGELVIPLDDDLPDAERPGFIVDGQQRLAAIREAEVASFPICVSAFITDDLGFQTEQFILVNSTKPLPKGLLYELLPVTQATLPPMLMRRRLPAELVALLNQRRDSPFHNRIQTATNPDGKIKDNSMLRMLEQSLTDGVLFQFNDRDTGPNLDAMVAVLSNYWRSVAKIFKNAWEQPPRRSRLVHGAGIVSMGLVMDAIAERHRARRLVDEEAFTKDLLALADVCRWTDGYWDFGPGQQRKWNEIQNTPKDIQLLSNYLLVQYKALVWSRKERTAQLGLIGA
ncbi:DGQHR domain-containing protein DpdB [Haliangium sp. UPWRP_2]|uniref:DGQHR domain-containing protein DpdB n=1 Tax=Haliangium sp. UPWRP_2 TaxID=1931276 RepID=UPI000B53E444|nr:DGQHR domain-containing protein DpdB [Haliangium sp. UPWRP_2]PSM32391.1 DGQHR domain-containing protein [Haliangium sp. UPWRP_2]